METSFAGLMSLLISDSPRPGQSLSVAAILQARERPDQRAEGIIEVSISGDLAGQKTGEGSFPGNRQERV
jgi:hypothetical protein